MVGRLKCPSRMAGGPLTGAEWPARGGHRHAARQLAESSGRRVHLPEQIFTPAIREGCYKRGFAPQGSPLLAALLTDGQLLWAYRFSRCMESEDGGYIASRVPKPGTEGSDDAGSLVNTGVENFSECFSRLHRFPLKS